MLASASLPAVGSRAPDFTLPDHDGNSVRLYGLLEKGPVVLYFYPKDETIGCTLQACVFRDRYAQFSAEGASLLGVSDDSVARHHSFRENHQIPFSLLSDPGGAVRAAYGVKKTLGLIPGRVTFVIDPQGTVLLVFSSQTNIRRHVDQALRAIQQARKSR